MRQRSIDELLFHLPSVERLATSDWERRFAASILAQSRRRDWRPSEKQLGIMRRLVSELFLHTGNAGEDVHVIDPD